MVRTIRAIDADPRTIGKRVWCGPRQTINGPKPVAEAVALACIFLVSEQHCFRIVRQAAQRDLRGAVHPSLNIAREYSPGRRAIDRRSAWSVGRQQAVSLKIDYLDDRICASACSGISVMSNSATWLPRSWLTL